MVNNDTFLKPFKKIKFSTLMVNFWFIREKISYVNFRSQLRSPKCTQIANSDEDLLWDVVDNYIDYSSNDLEKLQDVVQSTTKRSLKFK